MAGANIDLLLVGVSHRTAPVAVRERLAVEPDAVAKALAELTGLSAVRETTRIARRPGWRRCWRGVPASP